MKQVELAQQGKHMVCWVDWDEIKPGDLVTLKKIDGEWMVLEVYDLRIESVADLNRGWSNNI